MAEQTALALINGKISQIPASDTIRGASPGFQKYLIASAETYTIPIYFSSVVSGPVEVESTGILDVEGRLEII